MPVHRSKRSLMDIFADYSPKQMTNGQIRMECPFRENHEDGSGRISFFVSPDKNAYHCFTGDTKVPTSLGTFPIKDLVNKSVKVLSINGKFNTINVNDPAIINGINGIIAILIT